LTCDAEPRLWLGQAGNCSATTAAETPICNSPLGLIASMLSCDANHANNPQDFFSRSPQTEIINPLRRFADVVLDSICPDCLSYVIRAVCGAYAA
jgi:hypothetical protein